jgi:DNA-directed RNA polymerase subunit F
MEILDEKPVSIVDVKKILDAKSKEKKLGYEQNNVLEHLKKFCKLSKKNADQMAEGLGKIEKLKEKHIMAIVNNLPRDLDDLRLLFSNERVSISQEDKAKILDIVKKFT